MSDNPYVPRPRCLRCKGRRLVVNPAITEYVALIPCPACTHRRPPDGRVETPLILTEARAA